MSYAAPQRDLGVGEQQSEAFYYIFMNVCVYDKKRCGKNEMRSARHCYFTTIRCGGLVKNHKFRGNCFKNHLFVRHAREARITVFRVFFTFISSHETYIQGVEGVEYM